jgi:hypothetical protein
MCRYILNQLRQTDDVVKDVSPRSLIKNWPPAFVEWSTKSVRDAFYASPQFPRLVHGDSIRDTIARGVVEGQLAYVAKLPDGGYTPFLYKKQVNPLDIEISDDMFIITGAEAEKHIKPPELSKLAISPDQAQVQPGKKQTFTARGIDQFGRDFEARSPQWTATGGKIGEDGVFQAGPDEGNFVVSVRSGKVTGSATVTISRGIKPPPPPPPSPTKPKTLLWSGDVPPQKWMNLYTKVLTRFVKGGLLKLNVSIETTPADGVTEQHIDETKAALRELGLDDEIKTQ